MMESFEEISFGEWLRQRRRMLDLTQQDFADQVGCARITLRRIESDTLKPSKELALILLKTVGIPQNQLEQWAHFARGQSGMPLEQPISESKPQTNLPASLTSFIGRERELDQVTQLLEKHRLVTLVGPGGVGKTRLSMKVGEQLLSNYASGVWLIELAPLNNPELIPQTLTSIFGISPTSSLSVTEMLINYLRAKTALLILDNCEHVLDTCAELADTLLKQCPNLKILATSREALGILGEASYSVPSLGVPDSERLLDSYREFESVRLFEERAQLARFDFALTMDNASFVAQICQRLDGIPLAIELAAVHVGQFSPPEIATQLNDSFKLLTRGSRTALPRQQTLRASIDWSWGLLSDAEQIFLRQLSVFAGSWTLESAQAVCDGDAFSLISALIKKSLIIVIQEAERETRYRFHEVVRQYAREKLVESGEKEATCSRHLKYSLEFAEQAEAALQGHTQIGWHRRLNDERSNLRVALEWADKIDDVEAGLYLTGRLGYLWEQCDIQEGIRWTSVFTQKPKSNDYPLARAKALLTRTRMLIWLPKYEEARVIAQDCLAIYRTHKDQHGEIDSLLSLTNSMIHLGDVEQSLEAAQQARSLSRSLGDTYREALSLARVGVSHWELTHDLTYLEQAILLNRQLKRWLGLAWCTLAAGERALKVGSLQAAEKYVEESIALYRQLENKRGLSNALQTYGQITFARGDLERAHKLLSESVEISQEIGDREGYLWIRSRLGYFTLWQGDTAMARQIFSETTKGFSQDKIETGVAFNVEGMASLCIAIDKPSIAARLIGWADGTRERLKDTRPNIEQVEVNKTIAECLANMGKVAFSDAYDAGQKMTMDEVVVLALNES
jgi:predicted ATPase/DNA-binding XRE family transcriptional regulator